MQHNTPTFGCGEEGAHQRDDDAVVRASNFSLSCVQADSHEDHKQRKKNPVAVSEGRELQVAARGIRGNDALSTKAMVMSEQI